MKKKKSKGICLNPCCDICGKPITQSNEYGMFCDDWCGLKEAKKASKALDKFIDAIEGLVGGKGW